LALADRRIAEAAGGHGGLLLLAGEPGIGKSRLIRSIRQKATQAGFRTAQGDLLPHDSLHPLAAIQDMARAMKRDVFGSLGDDLLAVDRGSGGDSLGSRRGLIRETVDLILVSVDRPTMIGVDDLQWADELTLDVLSELARSARELPLLLYGAY